MFSSAFDDTYRFVTHVALTNCVEYFLKSKKLEEENDQTYASFIERQRLLHNAAVSVNSIVDWIHEDSPESSSKADKRR